MKIIKEFTLTQKQFELIYRDLLGLLSSTPENPKIFISPIRQYSSLLIVAIIILNVIGLSDGNYDFVDLTVFNSIAFLFAMYLFLFIPYCKRKSSRTIYNTSKALQNQQYLEISDDGVISSGEGHHQTLDWSQIYKLEKGQKNYLIFLCYSNAIGIPLKILSEEEQKALEYYGQKVREAAIASGG